MDDLEIFHRRLRHPPVEIQDVRLSVVVPDRRLVVQLDQILHIFRLPTLDQTLALVLRVDRHPLLVQRHPRKNHRHLPGTFEPQHVRVVRHGCQLLPGRRPLFEVRLAGGYAVVVYRELRPEEIRTQLTCKNTPSSDRTYPKYVNIDYKISFGSFYAD
jgi:hypothetical protein